MAKRVPIEGVPADPPVCVWCGRKVRAYTTDTWSREEGRIVRRVFVRWATQYGGLFERLSCALHFAEAAYAAGYRRKGAR